MATRNRWVALLVFALSALLYANTLSNDFAHDDRWLIQENPLIRSLRGIPALFHSNYWAPSADLGLYRPLVTASYAVNHLVGGSNPAGYHAANVFLHALNTALVWLLFRALSIDFRVAAAATVLFAVHAVHSEAVASVAGGRPELLAGFFLLLALICHVAHREREDGSGGGPSLLALAAFFLALLCKESAVTLIGVIVLTDWLYGVSARTRPTLSDLITVVRRRFWTVYSAYLGIVAAHLVIRFVGLQGREFAPPTQIFNNPLADLDFLNRLPNALWVGGRYLALLVFPRNLSYDYSYNEIPLFGSPFEPGALAVLAASGVAIGLIVLSLRLSRDLFFGLAFMAITFTIVSNVALPIGTIMGERLIYVPSIGFCLALAAGLRTLCAAIPPPIGSGAYLAVVAALVTLHGARAFERNRDWKNDEVLYLHDLAVAPRSAKVQYNAGIVLARKDWNDEALERFEKSIEIAPEGYAVPYHASASLLGRLGRWEEAIEMYERAIRRGSEDPEVHHALGVLLADRSTLELPRAIALLERAAEVRPGNAEFAGDLGLAYLKAHRYREARAAIERSLALAPEGPRADRLRRRLPALEGAPSRSDPAPVDRR